MPANEHRGRVGLALTGYLLEGSYAPLMIGGSPLLVRSQRAIERKDHVQEHRASGRDDGRHRYCRDGRDCRSEEHTSELQALMRISYAVFCLKKKKGQQKVVTRVTQDELQRTNMSEKNK